MSGSTLATCITVRAPLAIRRRSGRKPVVRCENNGGSRVDQSCDEGARSGIPLEAHVGGQALLLRQRNRRHTATGLP